MTQQRLGAYYEEWAHFSSVLALTADLLPVVCNLAAKISPFSSLTDIGKVPSQYNNDGFLVGFKAWTTHTASDQEVEAWASNPDYGICLQTRNIRAIDVDVDDPGIAATVRELLSEFCTAVRYRKGSSRFLILLRVPGPQPKTVIKLQQGAVEFLGDGQQCVVSGTHKSGARYEWDCGLPFEIPSITASQYSDLKQRISLVLGVAATSSQTTVTRAENVKRSVQNDPVAEYLFDKNLVLSESNGQLNITCPFEEEHSQKNAGSSTTYFVRHTHGYEHGHFKCLHAHCAERTDEQYLIAIGYEQELDFDVVDANPAPQIKLPRLATQSVEMFISAPSPKWLVKNLIPEKGLVVIYGQPSSGKTFFTLDLSCAISRGSGWRDVKTKQGRVVYLCAEGVGGFRNRLKAYIDRNSDALPPSGLRDFCVIADQLNVLEKDDVRGLVKSIGHASVIVLDTFASVFQGDENDGRDMGRAIRHCQKITELTGATVVLVHHTPKSGNGARGHGALKGAADVEIEVSQFECGGRAALVTKSKDGPAGADYGFDLDSVLLGVDEDGDSITSCAVVHGSAPVRKAKTKGKKKEQDVDAMLASFPSPDLSIL